MGVTTIVMTAFPPALIVPKEQLTVVDPMQVPWVAVAEPKLTPIGRLSEKFTFVAAAGPLLVTTARYDRLIPTCPGLGEAVLLSERSMLEGLTTLKVT